jgi:hypothetical protein
MKVGSVDAEVIVVSRLFQILAAATENIQSPAVFHKVLGTRTIRLVADAVEVRCRPPGGLTLSTKGKAI